MKKYTKWVLILIAIILIAGVAYFFLSQRNSQNNQTTQGTRTATEINVPNLDTNSDTNSATNNNINNVTENSQVKQEEKEPVETELAHFSTEILVEDNNRDNNLELTASKINGTVVKSGEEFSFNETVGNPTPDKGYEKAGIFVNGKKEKGYGGGNCQVSTTLYDTVLKVDGLDVTERHEHGKEVGYVEKGKDATVAYDYLDLKFKNNTGSDIKIYANVTEEKVNVKIVKLS